MDDQVNKEIYRQSQDCLLDDMGGEILLYYPVTAEAIQLNESSLIVWQMCNGTRTVEEIIDAVGELYPGQVKQIAEDVNFVIGSLVRSKALVLVS